MDPGPSSNYHLQSSLEQNSIEENPVYSCLSDINASFAIIAESLTSIREEACARDKALAKMHQSILALHETSKQQSERIDNLSNLFSGGIKDVALKMFGESFFSDDARENDTSVMERLENVEKSLKKIEVDLQYRSFPQPLHETRASFYACPDIGNSSIVMRSQSTEGRPVEKDIWTSFKAACNRTLKSLRSNESTSRPQTRDSTFPFIPLQKDRSDKATTKSHLSSAISSVSSSSELSEFSNIFDPKATQPGEPLQPRQESNNDNESTASPRDSRPNQPSSYSFSFSTLHNAASTEASSSHFLRRVGSSFASEQSDSSRQLSLEPLDEGSTAIPEENQPQLTIDPSMLTLERGPKTPLPSPFESPKTSRDDHTVNNSSPPCEAGSSRGHVRRFSVLSHSSERDLGRSTTPFQTNDASMSSTPPLIQDNMHSVVRPDPVSDQVPDSEFQSTSTPDINEKTQPGERYSTTPGKVDKNDDRECSLSTLSDLTSLTSSDSSEDDEDDEDLITPKSTASNTILKIKIPPRTPAVPAVTFSEISLSNLVKKTPVYHKINKKGTRFRDVSKLPNHRWSQLYHCRREGCRETYNNAESLEKHISSGNCRGFTRESTVSTMFSDSSSSSSPTFENGSSSTRVVRNGNPISNEYRPRKKRRVDKSASLKPRNATSSRMQRPVPTAEATAKEAVSKLKRLGVGPLWPTKTRVNKEFEYKSIRCDICERYYHYRCAGILEHDQRIRADIDFVCALCACSQSDNCTKANPEERKQYCCRPDCDLDGESDNDIEFAVEKILGRKRIMRGGEYIFLWLVKWEGYGMKECIWIPTSDMSAGGEEVRTEFINAAKKEGRTKDLNREDKIILLKEAFDFGFRS